MVTIPTTQQLLEARSRITGKVHYTPVHRSTLLGRQVGAHFYLKCENFQKTGSFKVRGALNKLLRLPDARRQVGVVTVSAGNHAQALAWSARECRVPCTVVMPEGASETKAAASRAYGADVILHGNVHDAFDLAYQLERKKGFTFIHPFDDPDIVSGHASMGFEILEQVPDVDVIVAGVGGGGHLSGIATAIKAHNPGVRLYGVEPEGASAMRQSLNGGRTVRLDQIDTIADGLAPPMVGELNFEIIRRFVDDVILVTDDEIVHAMGMLLSRTKLLAEPAGAAAAAALLAGKVPVRPSETVVAVLSGGNVSPQDLHTLGVGAVGS